MDTLSSEDTSRSSAKCLQSFKKTRQAQAGLFKTYESSVKHTSERQVAKILNIPRTTLQHWRKRKAGIGLSVQVVTFFESPEESCFFHQLVTSMLFVMVPVGGCGLRVVSQFLEHSQLNHFVASSVGSLHKLNVHMEKNIVDYGVSERERLSKKMPSKKISLCGDETFHPAPC